MRRLRSDATRRTGQNAATVYASSVSIISKEDRIIRFHLRCSLQCRTILQALTQIVVVKKSTNYESGGGGTPSQLFTVTVNS